MTEQLTLLCESDFTFPAPTKALSNPDGLLAVGGCLSLERLRLAYSNGIFPWYNDEEPILWWSPSQRGIIELDEFHVSSSTKKRFRQLKPSVSINTRFEEVIAGCQAQRINKEGTWINRQMLDAYQVAHQAGLAHSLEVSVDGELIGGLYGIMQNGVFCGESMFFNVSGASKIAMWQLVLHLKRFNAHFIDCQLLNPYLATMGAKSISRAEFLAKLKKAKSFSLPKTMWLPQTLGEIND